MTIDDLKIPGAKLPAIKGYLMSRIVNWDGPDQMINYGVCATRYSFGTIMYNDVQYILAEKKNYLLSLYYMIPTITIEELAIKQGMITKKKELPKSFACINTNQKLWDKFIKWLDDGFVGTLSKYYGVTRYGDRYNDNNMAMFDTIIPLEEWDEIVNGTQIKTEEVMKKHEITREQLKSIYDVACNTWKEKITEYANRNPFSDTVEFTQAEINEMFSASDVGQLKVLTSIFGKAVKELNFKSDSIDFKVDGIDVFSATNIRLIDAFITLPDSDLNYFHLNPDYLWEIKHNSLIVTRNLLNL
jgi:hypothetical protein